MAISHRKTLEFYVKMNKISDRFMPLGNAEDLPRYIRDRFGDTFRELEGKHDARRYRTIMTFTHTLSEIDWNVEPKK